MGGSAGPSSFSLLTSNLLFSTPFRIRDSEPHVHGGYFMSREYEMALIVDTQENADETISRYASLLVDEGATVVNIDRWGVRRLAYPIDKRQQGDYTFFYFEADPGAIADVERACRLDEAILRHLILQTVLPPQEEEEEVSEEVAEEEVAE